MKMTRSIGPGVILAATFMASALASCTGSAPAGNSTPAVPDGAIPSSPTAGAASTAVTWSITEGAGGTIDTAGRYVAPSSVGTFHVVARSVANTSISGSAVVTVTAAAPGGGLGPCASEPLRTTGTVYYVCDCQAGAASGCVAGSDTNAGTSPSAPWQSWAKAWSTLNTMAAGNTVALCRGGRWNSLTSQGYLRNLNCRAGSTCDLRDYAAPWNAGSEGSPILQVASNQSWLDVGWYQNYPQTAVQGIRLMNLDVRGANDGSTQAIRIEGKLTDLEVCSSTFRDGFDPVYAAITTSTVARVNFHHNQLLNNPFGIGPLQGMACSADCVFDSNVLDLQGGNTNRDHAMYIGSSPDPCGQFPNQRQASSGCYIAAQRTRITNNQITRSAWGAGGNSCQGSVIVVHEPQDDTLIENNLIYESAGTASVSCFGIDVSSGIDAPGAWNRMVVRRNRIFNVGGNAVGVAECANCVIEDNVIVMGGTDTAILYPRESCGISGSCSSTGDLLSTGGIVRNNTIYGPPAADGARCVGLGGEGSGYIHANNICLYQGQTMNWSGCFSASSTCAGCDTGNVCTTGSTNPYFVNPTTDWRTADFSEKSGSPTIDAGSAAYDSPAAVGTTTWAPSDAGIGRPLGGGPDAGAYER